MQIVIDIPEDVYTRLFDNGLQDNEIATEDICEMARALRLGMPISDNTRMREVVDECHFLCQWNSGSRCTKNPNERNCHKRALGEVEK